MTENLITTEEVAKRLDVKVKTVQLWLRQGKLPGVKLGAKTWRVKESDLERFVEQHTTHKAGD